MEINILPENEEPQKDANKHLNLLKFGCTLAPVVAITILIAVTGVQLVMAKIDKKKYLANIERDLAEENTRIRGDCICKEGVGAGLEKAAAFIGTEGEVKLENIMLHECGFVCGKIDIYWMFRRIAMHPLEIELAALEAQCDCAYGGMAGEGAAGHLKSTKAGREIIKRTPELIQYVEASTCATRCMGFPSLNDE